jgi:hypothetical protein
MVHYLYRCSLCSHKIKGWISTDGVEDESAMEVATLCLCGNSKRVALVEVNGIIRSTIVYPDHKG